MTKILADPLYREFYIEHSQRYDVMPEWWWDAEQQREHFFAWREKHIQPYYYTRSEKVTSHITKDDKARLEESAKHHKLSKSAFIRAALRFAFYNMRKVDTDVKRRKR